ncbi:MAG: GNAT family N-acetyltransferase [Myxococcota bacterium]
MRTPRYTDRLVIRPFRLEDRAAASKLWAVTFHATLTEERLLWMALTPAQLEDLQQPPIGDRAVLLRDTGTLVGVVGLTYTNGPYSLLDVTPPVGTSLPWTLEIGLFWAVHPDHRGCGYATEAARSMIGLATDHVRVPRVIAHTEHHNTPSRGVMERLGMDIQSFHDVPHAPWFQIVGQLPTLQSPG